MTSVACLNDCITNYHRAIGLSQDRLWEHVTYLKATDLENSSGYLNILLFDNVQFGLTNKRIILAELI